MSEIEKMYKNCGIYPDCRARECGLDYCANSSGCGYAVYPDFTAEKQIELIKLLAKNDNIYITYYPSDNTYNIRYCVSGLYDGSVMGDKEATSIDFGEALAGLINKLPLSVEEKQQVKGILE